LIDSTFNPNCHRLLFILHQYWEWGARLIHTLPATVFLRKLVREYSVRSYWSVAEPCERWGARVVLISVSMAYKYKILKFGFSDWIMSPSVGLTFPVSYTFCCYNNIMAEFQWKVWKDKLFYEECLWISFFQIFNFSGFSVIYLSLTEIPIWTHQRQYGMRTCTLTSWSF
jgi:hypothetical protein